MSFVTFFIVVIPSFISFFIPLLIFIFFPSLISALIIKLATKAIAHHSIILTIIIAFLISFFVITRDFHGLDRLSLWQFLLLLLHFNLGLFYLFLCRC